MATCFITFVNFHYLNKMFLLFCCLKLSQPTILIHVQAGPYVFRYFPIHTSVELILSPYKPRALPIAWWESSATFFWLLLSLPSFWVNDVIRLVLCSYETSRFGVLVGWCGRSRADLSFTQICRHWLSGEKQRWMVLCQIAGMECVWRVVRTFNAGWRGIFAKVLVRSHYQEC